MGQNHSTGKAGQLAVMSEIALRGYNVAIPEVDTGDDIFVVNDATGDMYRLQVKTSLGRPQPQQKSHRCQFEIRTEQITTPITPEIDYVFVTRLENLWEFVIIPREDICRFMSEGFGTRDTTKNKYGKEYIHYSMVFYEDGKVIMNKKKDITKYKNNWDKWESIASQRPLTT